MTSYCDQLNSDVIKQLWERPALQGGMDVIIDDGMQTFEGSVSVLDGWRGRGIGRALVGGIYILKDIAEEKLGRWLDVLERTYPRRFPNHDFRTSRIPDSFKIV